MVKFLSKKRDELGNFFEQVQEAAFQSFMRLSESISIRVHQAHYCSKNLLIFRKEFNLAQKEVLP